MSELFNNVSSILRDRTIIDLQKENQLLNKKIKNINGLFFGSKVKLINTIHDIDETEAIMVGINGYNAQILIKDNNNNICLRSVYVNHLIFIDENISEFYYQHME